MNKSDYIRKWDRFQRRWENYYTKRFKAALKIQIDQQIKNGYITSDPILHVLEDLYKRCGVAWAHATQVVIKKQEVKGRMPMGFSERIVELMRQYYGIEILEDANEITQYTREVIQNVLSEAAITGWSFDEIVRQLQSNSELGAMRARRIARTEVVGASNAAAITNAKDTGIPMVKIWLAVRDKRTRHSHMAADDVTIPIDDAFTIGGVKMMQPGVKKTPDGQQVPGAQIINCRCVLGFRTIKKT